MRSVSAKINGQWIDLMRSVTNQWQYHRVRSHLQYPHCQLSIWVDYHFKVRAGMTVLSNALLTQCSVLACRKMVTGQGKSLKLPHAISHRFAAMFSIRKLSDKILQQGASADAAGCEFANRVCIECSRLINLCQHRSFPMPIRITSTMNETVEDVIQSESPTPLSSQCHC